MWKIINKLINKKSKTTIINEIDTEHGSITHPKQITNVLNEHFFNIGYNQAENLESTSVQPSCYVHQHETEFKLDRSIISGIFPEDLKIAVLYLFLKKVIDL